MTDGGPAFPRATYVELDQAEYRPNVPGRGSISGDDGMSLRDWFAGQLVPVLVAAAIKSQADSLSKEKIATDAYDMADAMLAEREKKS